MARALLIALVSFWLTGCFVFEELRKGDEILEQHSSRWRKKKEADAAAALAAAEEKAKKSGSLVDWKKAKGELSDWWEEAVEEDPVGPAPDDEITRCVVNGQVLFTRKSQCETQGGQTTGDYSKSKTGT